MEPDSFVLDFSYLEMLWFSKTKHAQWLSLITCLSVSFIKFICVLREWFSWFMLLYSRFLFLSVIHLGSGYWSHVSFLTCEHDASDDNFYSQIHANVHEWQSLNSIKWVTMFTLGTKMPLLAETCSTHRGHYLVSIDQLRGSHGSSLSRSMKYSLWVLGFFFGHYLQCSSASAVDTWTLKKIKENSEAKHLNEIVIEISFLKGFFSLTVDFLHRNLKAKTLVHLQVLYLCCFCCLSFTYTTLYFYICICWSVLTTKILVSVTTILLIPFSILHSPIHSTLVTTTLFSIIGFCVIGVCFCLFASFILPACILYSAYKWNHTFVFLCILYFS